MALGIEANQPFFKSMISDAGFITWRDLELMSSSTHIQCRHKFS